MAERRVSIRLAAVDGDRVKAELMNIGREGKQAFEAIGKAGETGSAGVNRVGNSANSALRQMEALAERATRAALALRTAGASTGTFVERIDAVTGAAPRLARSAADIEAYGAELDRLRARHNPLFAVINEYRNKLADIRQAHSLGAISADEMANAISRERQAALASISAIKGRTNAIVAMGSASQAAQFQMRNLQFQLVDIAQGIPLLFQAPAAGLLNFANQGAQIAQIYGPEEGGVGRAFREAAAMAGRFAVRLLPIAAAAAAVTAGISGMQHEINEVSSVTVSFGDTALATWQVISSGIYDFIKPAVDALAPWFSAAWEAVIAVTKIAGNALIGAMRLAVLDMRFAWEALPSAIGGAVTGAANATITGIEWMVNQAISLLNNLSAQANAVLEKIPGLPGGARVGNIDPISIGRFENPAADDFAEQLARRNAEAARIAQGDPLGEFFDAVKQQAIANALKRTAEETNGVADAMDRLKSEAEAVYRSVRTPAEEYADTMADLNRLLDAGALSMDIYGRAAEAASEKLRKLEEEERKRKLEEATDPLSGAIRGLEAYAEQAGTLADTIESAVTGAFKGAEDAVRQFVSKGKIEFGSLISSLIADLAVLSVKQAVLGPIAGALGGLLGGTGGAGGLFASVLHEGGIVGTHGRGRAMPAMAFVGAPRMHSGGIAGLRPDEVPAILQRGERVLTRDQNRQWEGGRMIQVNISTPDIESFRQSRTQISADLARAVSFGSRGM